MARMTTRIAAEARKLQLQHADIVWQGQEEAPARAFPPSPKRLGGESDVVHLDAGADFVYHLYPTCSLSSALPPHPFGPTAPLSLPSGTRGAGAFKRRSVWTTWAFAMTTDTRAPGGAVRRVATRPPFTGTRRSGRPSSSATVEKAASMRAIATASPQIPASRAARCRRPGTRFRACVRAAWLAHQLVRKGRAAGTRDFTSATTGTSARASSAVRR
mmetsp:Transcript_15044/g.37465  ORF Transcript_15044/g.37465 Transcript_15044/m.37465 type:complete len:216 (-) Transcript_15044:2615-3262(-)